MSLLNNVTKGKQKPPVLAIFYGSPGVGKSTLAANAPSPIFIGSENGTAFLDVVRFPQPKSFDDVRACIKALINENHEYKTLVIDSLDWMEPLIFQKVIDDVTAQGGKNVTNIEHIGYGKGYAFALTHWQSLISDLSMLRERKGMNILLIAHAHVKKIEDPKTQSSYDRYLMKVNDKAAAILREYVDVMCYCTFEVHTAKDENKKTRAYGGDERVMHTVYSAAYDAKNRMGLPPELPVDWDAFIEAYNAGSEQRDAPGYLGELLAHIEVLNSQTKDDIREQVIKSVSKANGDIDQLVKIRNRLQTLVAVN